MLKFNGLWMSPLLTTYVPGNAIHVPEAPLMIVGPGHPKKPGPVLPVSQVIDPGRSTLVATWLVLPSGRRMYKSVLVHLTLADWLATSTRTIVSVSPT